MNVNNIFEVLFLTTVRCNAKCIFCCEQGEERDDSLETMLSYIEPLVKGTGVQLIDLNGGEPLLREREQILSLMKEIDKNGSKTSVSTNTLPMFPGLIREMRPYVDIVNVSLHGFYPETNDGIMQVPGATERIKRNILDLVDSEYDVHVTTVVLRENIEQIPEIARWCYENQIRTYCMNVLFGRGRGGSQLEKEQPPVQDLMALRDELREEYSGMNIYVNESHVGQCVILRPNGMITGAPQNPNSSQDGLVPISHVHDPELRAKWESYPYRQNHHRYNREKFRPYLSEENA